MRSKVVTLNDYRRRLFTRSRCADGTFAEKPLPRRENLWELLERNISIETWKRESSTEK